MKFLNPPTVSISLALSPILSAATITGAVFDPNDAALSYYNNGIDANLDLNGSETLTFDMDNGTMSFGGTSYSASSVQAEDSSFYWVFAFENFSVGQNVTIDVTWGNTPPPVGLAILSSGDFTLQTDLSYSDPARSQAYEGGNISLISRGDMLITSTISADGSDGKGSNKNGQTGGYISIATASTLDISSATISSTGGEGSKAQDADGNGGDLIVYASEVTGDLASITDVNGGTDGVLGTSQFNIGTEFVTSDVSYLAVPEPSSSAMLMLAGLGFLTRRKRLAI